VAEYLGFSHAQLLIERAQHEHCAIEFIADAVTTVVFKEIETHMTKPVLVR
jgi:hypothetical protein